MRLTSLLPLAAAPMLAGCLTPNQPPPPGAYLATGHDPEWNLVIDERNIAFMRAGEAPVVEPAPPATIGVAGELYRTPRLNVNLLHSPCTDSMTGRPFRDRVQIDVDGRRFEGCGGDPGPMQQPPAALAGTSWRVVAVNGRPTPAQGQYYLRFDARRLAARFGCNSMSGSYIQRGDRLDVSQLVSTRMACMGPAMEFENQGSAILSRPASISWSGNVATLSNPAGRIELSRTPA